MYGDTEILSVLLLWRISEWCTTVYN